MSPQSSPFSPTTVVGAQNYPAELVAAVVRATEAAASACLPLVGSGDKNAADELAVAAMRNALGLAPFDGTVVIGEGEKDEAPMLANGERLGTGAGPACDVAVDPLDGTRLAAENLPGAVAVIALAPRGSMFDPRDVFYMQKLIAGPAGIGVLDVRAAPAQNATRLAEALGKPLDELVIGVLDKPRHASLIAELSHLGVRVHRVAEGDVSIAIAAATPASGIDAVMGTGGTPEGIIAACAVRSLGGFMQGRMAPQSESQRAAAVSAGHDLTRVFTLDELVASDRVLFVSTPVT
ncbi:fructose-1,6-bisphosphatase II [Agreia bicolorata]|uniref:Fructose-1,6-bisphosphatase class 2 n=1 Tax=Agreia bicolorata TaxID=110935 RepID=A0A1T4XI91_9MICO|nr:class II fructose-bisphosphatase [Agreia bicolorata]SKA88828.1 fructose-1,6-bisphosphatase II [Agreia bicolorata]